MMGQVWERHAFVAPNGMPPLAMRIRSVNSTGHGLVPDNMMRGALERQEGVNRRNGRWVGSPHPDLGSPRSIARLVGDLGPPGRHDGGTRDYLSMHLEWSREISGSKGGGDFAHWRQGGTPGPDF